MALKFLVFFLIALILFIVIYCYFIYWNDVMKDIYILVFKFGKMGAGKTMDIIKSSQEDLKSGDFKHVYTSVKSPGCHFFDPKRIAVDNKYSFPPYSSVYIDEVGLLWNSRKFKTFPDAVKEWAKMIRQQHLKVTLYSQSPDIDKAFRDLCMEYHIMRRWFVFTLDRLVYKKIDVGQDRDGNGDLIDTFEKAPLIGGIRINYMPRYVGIFSSFNPPLYNCIPSTYIVPNEKADLSSSFFRWSVNNFKTIFHAKFQELCKKFVHE